jgi:diacylglycerol O-acyltransferase / wax synthase
MHHLSALDALFLYLETPEMPMHVGSLILLEKPKGHRGSFYKNIRSQIESRMHLVPLFSRKLAFMPLDLTNPVWVNAKIDIDRHITRMILAKPGTQAQLEAAVAKLHEGMLDRDRPLWEFTVIEGLQSGLVGFYSRIHHAALDGQGGVALAHAVLDTEPVPRAAAAPGHRAAARRAPSTAKMLGAAFRHTVAQYVRIVKAVPGVIRMARDAGAALLSSSEARKAGAPSEQGTGIPALGDVKPGDSLENIVRSLLKKIPGGISLGPRSPFNVAISPDRDFVGTQISLAETKAIARHFDAKLNDVALAICAAAMRRYFARDKTLFAKPMICAVPASLRVPGDTSHGNLVTMMLVNMATNIAEPGKRLAAIVASSARAKAITGGMKSVIPTDMPSLGVPWLMSVITPLYRMAVETNRIPVVANLVVSNVPGPQVPMYMAGATMRAYFPVSIIVHGLALNITILSYNGSMDYGLIACKRTVTRLPEFAEHMQAAHQELLALVKADLESSGSGKVVARAAPKRAAGKAAEKRAVGKTAAKKVARASPEIKAAPQSGARLKKRQAVGAKVAAKKKRA